MKKDAFQELLVGSEFVFDMALDLVADTVLFYFGPGDRVLDNMLEPEDRALFYRLEEAGLLRSEEESLLLPISERAWHIRTWVLLQDGPTQRDGGRASPAGLYEQGDPCLLDVNWDDPLLWEREPNERS